MADSFEKLAEEKQKSIRTIGMQFFTNYGYASANTVDIAKACGIAKGSLFHYFSSKKGFFLYLVRHCTEKILYETRQRYFSLNSTDYFERLRKGVEIKITLPLLYPNESAFLAKAFAENASEAGEELRVLAADSAMQMRELNDRFIGRIEREKVKSGIDYDEACVFIQTVLDGCTARLLRQYHTHPQELLDHMEVLSEELGKTIGFLLYGIGK